MPLLPLNGDGVFGSVENGFENPFPLLIKLTVWLSLQIWDFVFFKDGFEFVPVCLLEIRGFFAFDVDGGKRHSELDGSMVRAKEWACFYICIVGGGFVIA